MTPGTKVKYIGKEHPEHTGKTMKVITVKTKEVILETDKVIRMSDDVVFNQAIAVSKTNVEETT